MSYRDTAEALRAYRDRVAADLDEARKAAKEASERAARVGSLEKELTETEGLLAKVGTPRALPVLEDIRIAAPCKANWDDMAGDDRVRFCGECRKNVYNLSAMPRSEAEALLAEKEGAMCVRLFRREDGTVITDDCPVGVRRRRRRGLAAAVAVGGGLLAASAGAGSLAMTGKPAPTTGAVRMGTVAVDPGERPTSHVVQGEIAPPPPPTVATVGVTAPPRIRPLMGAPVRRP